MNLPHRCLPPIGLMLLGTAVLGCSTGPVTDYSGLGLVEVSGKVTLDGDPVAGAAVFFLEPDETYSFGVTDDAGYYKMMFNSEKSGVTPGQKRVEITTTKNPLGEAAGSEEFEEFEEDPDAPANPGGELIPACYNTDSQLNVVIDESESSLDFELRSDCSTSEAS